MARLAAERLGDTRLAIEVYNGILGDSRRRRYQRYALVALGALYDREKRHLALAEILHRQIAAAKGKDAIALLERLGQIYAERLSAPQQAATAWKDILDLEPNHAKALRTLREASTRWRATSPASSSCTRSSVRKDELVEALLAIADRIDLRRRPRGCRSSSVRRKQLAQKPAPESCQRAVRRSRRWRRRRQVWERVLAVEPLHVGAAAALAPIYDKQEKWARLLSRCARSSHRCLAAERAAGFRLAKIGQIRALCEQKLASKTLAFHVGRARVRASILSSDQLYEDGDAARERARSMAARCFRRVRGALIAKAGNLPEAKRLEAVPRAREDLGAGASAIPEKSRGYHRQVLQLAPEDRDAESKPRGSRDAGRRLGRSSLASFRRRAQRETQAAGRKAALLIEAAGIQEQKLVDLDGACADVSRSARRGARERTRVA